MRKKEMILLSGLILAILFFTYNNKNTISQTITIDYPIALEVDTLIEEADIIVKGRYKEYLESWNMARNPIDIMKPAEDMYIEGKVFRFEVDAYIKGEGDKEIRVNLRYKHETIIDERYIEPTIDEAVVLFLLKNQVFNNYYGVMEPFQFGYSEDVLEVKTNIADIKKSFAGNKPTQIEIMNKVKN